MHIARGQTLFELSITLSITACLSLFAIEGWQYLHQKYSAQVAISRTATAIREARQLALSQRRVTTLCPSRHPPQCDRDWSGPLILFTGVPDDPEKVILKTYPALSRGTLRWSAFRNNGLLQMQSNGLTLAYNGTFTYCPDNRNLRHARALILNKSGRARAATDLNGDGIMDLRKGEPISCP